ncbi:MAG: FtsX-like permease family protein [Bacteroidota bacterium]
MHPIFFLLREQIRQRKKALGLLFASLTLASTLLTAGLSLLWGLHAPFETTFERLRGAHFLLFFDLRTEAEADILAWFSQQAEVQQVSPLRPVMHQDGPFFHQQQAIEVSLYLREYQHDSTGLDQLQLIRGGSTQPQREEIWLPVQVAEMHHIQLGDTFFLPMNSGRKGLRVSGWVIDAHFASGMVNPSMAWVAPGSLAEWYPLDQIQQTNLGVRLYEADVMPQLWDRFLQEFSYHGNKMDHLLFRTAFGSLFGIIGSLLLLAASMIFGLALFLTDHHLARMVRQEYRSIGILKSIGFRPREILQLLRWQIAILAVPASLLGIWAGESLVPVLMRQSLRHLSYLQLETRLAPLFLAGALFGLGIWFSTYRNSRKAAKIPASQAISQGQSSASRRLPKQWMSRLTRPIPLLIGGLIQSNLGRSGFFFLSAMVCASLMGLLIHTAHSFQGLLHQPTAWGFEAAEVTLRSNSAILLPRPHAERLELLETFPEIETIFSYQWAPLTIIAQQSQSAMTIQGRIYQEKIGFSGLTNLEGRHPQSPLEISLCIGTAQRFGLGVGDSIWVQLEGLTQPMWVTGIYQDIGNMGQGYRLSASAVLAINPLFEPDLYGIQLQAGVERQDFLASVHQSLGELFEAERSMTELIQSMGVVEAVSSICSLLWGFFALLLLLMIRFDLSSLQQEEAQHLRHSWAIGATPAQIRAAILGRMALLLGLGIGLGSGFGCLPGPALLSFFLTDLGLPDFPFQFSWTLQLWLALLIWAAGLLLIWFSIRGWRFSSHTR